MGIFKIYFFKYLLGHVRKRDKSQIGRSKGGILITRCIVYSNLNLKNIMAAKQTHTV